MKCGHSSSLPWRTAATSSLSLPLSSPRTSKQQRRVRRRRELPIRRRRRRRGRRSSSDALPLPRAPPVRLSLRLAGHCAASHPAAAPPAPAPAPDATPPATCTATCTACCGEAVAADRPSPHHGQRLPAAAGHPLLLPGGHEVRRGGKELLRGVTDDEAHGALTLLPAIPCSCLAVM